MFLYPEEFTDLETTRRRTPKKVAVDPTRIGELTAEERQIIAEYRLKDTAGAVKRKT